MGDAAISVRGLRKSYGETEAVRGIDFDVMPGEVFGFLGPNGAGKTTTIEILEGYREPSAGEVSVLGVDPSRPNRAWRERVGLVLQECELDPLLTVSEAVGLFATFYRAPRPVEETIELVGLGEKRDARIGSLSGGQKRRVDVAVGIIGDPDLIFLDEPTTGFDPAARRGAWRMIEGLRAIGKTVFLTTHYMDEAQQLADRVAILRDGRIVAHGATDEIAAHIGRRTEISFELDRRLPPERLRAATATDVGLEVVGPLVRLASEDPQRDLQAILELAAERGVELRGLEVRRPTLDDVFLQLTGEGAPA
jgi:ABC-2 type transport system ATP-binding protein